MAALIFVLPVMACAHSRPSGRVTIDLPALDARLAAPCRRPVPIKGDSLTGEQVQRGWARDRAALAGCGAEKAALVDGYLDLRAKLAEIGR